MKKSLLCLLLAVGLCLACLIAVCIGNFDKLFPSAQTDPDTETTSTAESNTEPPTETETITNTDIESETETETETRIVTETETETEPLGCVHSFGNWAEIKPATCLEEGVQERTCSLCQETESETIALLAHTYVNLGTITGCGSSESFPAQICLECCQVQNADTGDVPVTHPHSFIRVAPKEPTCTEDGFDARFECKNCEYAVESALPSLGHLWSNTAHIEGTAEVCRYYLCQRSGCDAIRYEFHEYKWTLTNVPATCAQEGTLQGVCRFCYHTITHTLDASHQWDDGIELSQPSCTEDGSKQFTCTVCGTVKTVPIDALGHSYGDYVSTNNPGSPCEFHKICSRCDAEEFEIIHDFGEYISTNNPENPCEFYRSCNRCELEKTPKTIHDDELISTQDPTCTESGKITHQCTRCHRITELSTTPYGHNMLVIAEHEVTCTTGGYTIEQCQRCEYMSCHIYSPLGHKDVWAYNTIEHWKECDRCDLPLTSCEAHSLVLAYQKEPLLGGGGYKYVLYYTCHICGYEQLIGDGIHVHDEAVIIPGEPATCTEPGFLPGLKCAVIGCEEVFIEPEPLDALGHNYVNRICTRCGDVLYSEGLSFVSNDDGTCYVAGIGTCTDTDIFIPPISPAGDTVTSIGEYAFRNCSKLVLLLIPDSVTSIGTQAFQNCLNLTNVTIGNGVANIGDHAFWDCSYLTSLFIPDNVTSIGDYAFACCTGLTLIQVDEHNPVYHSAGNCLIETEAKTLLVGCSTSVIPSDGSVTEIGKCAFRDLEALTSIVIPEGITSIGDDAFGWCSGLTQIVLPDSVTHVGSLAFRYCTNLTSITLGSNLAHIDTFYPFDSCYKLVEIINKSSLTITAGSGNEGHIAHYAKEVHDGTTKIANQNGYLFYTYNDVYYLLGYAGTDTALILPESYNGQSYEIYPYAFYSRDDLTSIVISDGVTDIGEQAFFNCSGLTNVELPNNSIHIGEWAFGYCSGLTSIVIPESIADIDDLAFDQCNKLIEVINKSSLPIVAGDGDYGRVALYAKEVHDGTTKIVNHNGYLFYTYGGRNYLLGYVETDTSLILPESYNGQNYEIYIDAFFHRQNLTSIVIPDNVTSIGSSAFAECINLTSIVIPNSVTVIGADAFDDCARLASIVIPDNVASIGNNAFSDTAYNYDKNNWTNGVLYIGAHLIEADYSLTGSYTIKAGTKTIADYAFHSCVNLTNIEIPNSVTSIGASAFCNCTSLTSVVIPDSVTVIGDCAFSDCSSLISVTLGNGITIIEDYAFSYCTSLTSIVIPDSVAYISFAALCDCPNLTTIMYGGTEEQWSEIGKGAYWNTSTDNYTIIYNHTEK